MNPNEAQTAAELIAHLESGGLIARGGPGRATYLRLELSYNPHTQTINAYLGCYGWGSALGSVAERLFDVVKNPHLWVKVENGESGSEIDASARRALLALGEYDQSRTWEWRITAKDTRKPNVGQEDERQ